ncbi:MAG TPA: thioesterase domain-containing protein [Bacillota bacterium]|nr:thioesterase domain-containing protein [Bacillota bacterium]
MHKSIKLFCLPYAGGSAMVYTKWRKYLNPWITLHPVEMAGRGKRFQIPLYQSFPEAVDDLCRMIQPELLHHNPYAFFGHSMGSFLVYELTRKLIALNYPEPAHLFLSGRYPPHIKKEEKVYHLLPEEEFRKEILEMGGTPPEVFEHQELLDIFLPILRADYKILETYESPACETRFGCPITTLLGDQDKDVSKDDMEQWRDYTTNQFDSYQFDGGHFFINEKTEAVVKIINQHLSVI